MTVPERVEVSGRPGLPLSTLRHEAMQHDPARLGGGHGDHAADSGFAPTCPHRKVYVLVTHPGPARAWEGRPGAGYLRRPGSGPEARGRSGRCESGVSGVPGAAREGHVTSRKRRKHMVVIPRA
ncbi:hypothetical protein Misp01_18400 [Microtetraspora sp. NBRC 13810]|nr:hypothetical protein Misp01_18400 [Microtetraspora sp. NBRC 13810]